MKTAAATLRYVESLNQALHRLMREDERVMLIGEDIMDPYGGAFNVARGLSTTFPDRVLTTPISEAAIVGLGTGLALRGFRPIVEIMFGDFLMLAADQIVNHATKFRWMYNDQVRVPLVIRTPMGGRRGYGPTHSQTLEQFFLGTPGLRIVAPSQLHDPGEMLRAVVLTTEDPVLFVENKSLYAERLPLEKSASRLGDFTVRVLNRTSETCPTLHLSLAPEETADVVLICYGGTAPLALNAARRLFLKNEVKLDVLVVSSLKPLPVPDITESVRLVGRALILEEGNIIGGWGAEIASRLTAENFGALRAPIQRLGAADCPIPAAKDLEQAVLPQVSDIVDAVEAILRP